MIARAARAALIAVGLLPFATVWARDLPALGVLARAADVWFSLQCEREAARMLAWPAAAVCSRCLGIYAGLGLGAALLRPRLSPRALRLWITIAALLMVLDVATEFLGLRPALAPLRFATGFGLAYPVGAALVRAVGVEASRARS